MNRIIPLVILLSLIPAGLLAQFEDPVEVTSKVIESARSGEVVTILVKTEMEDEWHIYAVYDVEGGPIATNVEVTGEIIENVGKVIEPEPTVAYDEGFQMETRYHKGTSTFRIPVKLKSGLEVGDYTVSATVLYQVCNEGLCYPPKEVKASTNITIEAGSARPGRTELILADNDESVDDSGNIDLDKAIQKGFFSFILLSISMGFLALLTPCVFPMIPITVSFFTHQGEIEGRSPLKQAIVYALGIIATFSFLGFLLAIFLGASGANQLAANPWVNLFIGALFTYFALSLFGAYEIQLPQSLRQLSQSQESRSGYLGILFMALTFTLTSFTCTVQFVGLLLVAASQGQWFWPAVGMIVFSAAFATPFFFLALFPQYLAKMPKSGGWLNAVKVVMGFLELAAAFKFFSNTDLVWEWGIFTHKSVLAAWTMIMLFTGFYLLGKIQLPHDSKIQSIGVPRMILSLFFLTFGLYMGTGLFGKPIHGLIYSYLPPKVESESGVVVTNGGMANKEMWFTELDSGLREAARTDMPLFVDFTGYTCTNCRWMESNIFTLPEVQERFEQYVLVQLYTDGGENYREKQQYEIDRFGTAALPFYVLLTPDNEEIARFPGMTRDAQQFIRFLDKGL